MYSLSLPICKWFPSCIPVRLRPSSSLWLNCAKVCGGFSPDSYHGNARLKSTPIVSYFVQKMGNTLLRIDWLERHRLLVANSEMSTVPYFSWHIDVPISIDDEWRIISQWLAGKSSASFANASGSAAHLHSIRFGPIGASHWCYWFRFSLYLSNTCFYTLVILKSLLYAIVHIYKVKAIQQKAFLNRRQQTFCSVDYYCLYHACLAKYANTQPHGLM